MRQLKDPSWKSGPTYSEPADSDHAMDIEPAGIDIDGIGVDEAEQTDETLICAAQEAFLCHRDMCDAMTTKRHVYALEDLTDDERAAVADRIEWTDDPTDEDLIEWIATHVEVVDYSEAPIIGEDGVGLYITRTETFVDSAHGPCYGEPDRPDPEPYGL